jgi:hypothetical protein
MAVVLLLMLLFVGCAGDPFESSPASDAQAPDAGMSDGAAAIDASAAAADGMAADVAVDAADVAVVDVDAAADVAVVDVDAAADVNNDAPCTPVSFPLPEPPGCAADYGPAATAGRFWLLQSEATPHACWSYAVVGIDRCQSCAETWNCACVGALLVDAGDPWSRGTSGAGCVDGASGPYWSQ